MAGQADGDRTGPAVRCVACGQVPTTFTAVWPAWRAARYLSHMHADVRTPAAWHLAQIGAAAPHLGPGACRALLELTTGSKAGLARLLPATPSAWCAGARPGRPWPSSGLPSPARRRSGLILAQVARIRPELRRVLRLPVLRGAAPA